MANTNSKRAFPIGAIVFIHEDCPDCPTERVPFMTEDELVERFQKAVDDGLDPDMVWPYVRTGRPDVAEKLFQIMDKGYGERYDSYSLTPENIDVVLGNFTVVIPAGKVKA